MFHWKQTILIFLDQICPKWIFPFQNKKVNISIEFSIFELVWMPNLPRLCRGNVIYRKYYTLKFFSYHEIHLLISHPFHSSLEVIFEIIMEIRMTTDPF